jgi:oligoendopeptidase F
MTKVYKTDWDLKQFYSSIDDPKIKKDVDVLEKKYKAFEKKYKDKTDYLKNPKKLLTALYDFEALGADPFLPSLYTHLASDLNSSDEKMQALSTSLSMRLTKINNRVIFFPLAINKIPKPFQKKILADKKFAYFKYSLKMSFDTAKYDLTLAEEKILNLKSLPSYSLWVRGVEKSLNEKTIDYGGKNIPISEALSLIRTLKIPDRYEVHEKTLAKIKEVADFSTSEINAIYINKKINDELHGFSKPYSNTLLYHEISEKTLSQLRESVKKWQKVSHDFFALKAKLLKLDTLHYPDRGVGIGENKKKISFDEAVKILSSSFEKIGPWYAQTFQSFLEKGQVDVFPKVGKTGGAYCSGGSNRPTFILLNHIENFDSVMTFGHEMGHAFHTELSKKQGLTYQGYSTAVAEVASTFFENIVFEETVGELTKQERIFAMHDRIDDDIQTIFRQMACFEFELELHESIRAKGNVSKEEIAALMNKHMQSYLGPVFKLAPDDGYFFISWSHIRNFFYVYSYAYGQIVSKALYKKYREDNSFFKKIEQFLSAGGSKSPEQIFKDIGIDTNKSDFFELGLKSVAEDIKLLEKLAKEEKLI